MGESTMKHIQIVPRDAMRLYDAIVKKEAEIRKNKRGTFFRAGGKGRNRATWKHKKYSGQVDLESAPSGVVNVKIKSRADDGQILKAFLNWLDRHFSDKLASVSIHYQ
jgi:hypothetical protein